MRKLFILLFSSMMLLLAAPSFAVPDHPSPPPLSVSVDIPATAVAVATIDAPRIAVFESIELPPTLSLSGETNFADVKMVAALPPNLCRKGLFYTTTTRLWSNATAKKQNLSYATINTASQVFRQRNVQYIE